MDDERLLLPRNLIAKTFGVHIDTVAKWGVKPVKKVGRESLYYLPDVLATYLSRNGSPQAKLTEEKTRLAKAQADKTEIEVQVIKGNAIKSEIVSEVWTKIVMSFRAKMLSMPTKIAQTLHGLEQPEMESKSRDLIYEVMEELSEYEPSQYGARACERGDKESGAAANTHD